MGRRCVVLVGPTLGTSVYIQALGSDAEVLTSPGIALTEVAGRVEFPAAEVDQAANAAARERLGRELDRAEGRLANPGFLAKAPPEVVEKERARVTELKAALERLDE